MMHLHVALCSFVLYISCMTNTNNAARAALTERTYMLNAAGGHVTKIEGGLTPDPCARCAGECSEKYSSEICHRCGGTGFESCALCPHAAAVLDEGASVCLDHVGPCEKHGASRYIAFGIAHCEACDASARIRAAKRGQA
jgi:hypothetical protein